MKRIAIILSLTSSPALAEITPMDVIENWRTVYAGLGEVISYGSLQAGPDGKSVLLSDVSSTAIMGATTFRIHFDWVQMQPAPDGGILISFSPDAEKLDVTRFPDGTETTITAQLDLSALTLVATGFPSDIRYSYSAPQITYSEEQGDEDSSSRTEITITDLSGEETAITNVTESGPRVADFGEYHFGKVEIRNESASIMGLSSVTQIVANDILLIYRWEFPLTDIPASPVPMADLPPQVDLMMEVQTGKLSGTIDTESLLGSDMLSFEQESGSGSLRFAQNRLRFEMVSNGSTLGMKSSAPKLPRFELRLADLRTQITMPFRRAPNATPFSAALSLSGLALDETSWASVDPENSMGRPTAELSISVSGLMKLAYGIFESEAGLENTGSPLFIPDLTVDALRIAVADAMIEGNGNLRFSPLRSDPNTDLPMAKGALDFSITGALGFLDRFGRLTSVEPMAILAAKGGLGMFARPTDAPDSFTSRVEFMSGGGIVINGQTVR